MKTLLDMLNLSGVLTVIVAFLIPSQHGSPIQSKDILDILDFLKSQNYMDVSKQKTEITSSDSSSEEDSANNSIYGLLKNMEVIDLIEKANQDKSSSESQKRNDEKTHKRITNPVYRNYEINRHRDSEQQQIPEQLLLANAGHSNKPEYQRLTPNNLLSSLALDHGDKLVQDDSGLSDYSKIFVVLDPLAIQKSKNRDAVKNLVSRILSLYGGAYSERNRSRYKGFKVKNNLLSRRYRRDSKEMYGGRDSLEDDFKQKRSRNDHGGGTGGRTAIPYIRQRGDIYERDH